jgi:hypothetical protein
MRNAALTSEEVSQRISRLRASFRQGDPGGVGLSFAEALEAAVAAGDRRAEVYLCRCAGMVFAPAIALDWLSRARLLAKSYGLREEEAPALANLGVVHLELGDFAAQAGGLERSAEPQAWLYRTPWALCPIPLDLPAVLSEKEST